LNRGFEVVSQACGAGSQGKHGHSCVKRGATLQGRQGTRQRSVSRTKVEEVYELRSKQSRTQRGRRGQSPNAKVRCQRSRSPPAEVEVHEEGGGVVTNGLRQGGSSLECRRFNCSYTGGGATTSLQLFFNTGGGVVTNGLRPKGGTATVNLRPKGGTANVKLRPKGGTATNGGLRWIRRRTCP
jgi:hypothetical protein